MDSYSSFGSAAKAGFLALSFIIAAAHADEISCKRQKYDPGFPAALLGKYEIIGKMPDSDVTYRGTLEIDNGKTAYTLKRSVNGKAMIGEAWIENCGTDASRGIQILSFKYTKGKGLLEGYCFFQSDLENDMLLSCYANSAGTQNERPGLESMFPIKDF